MILEGEAAAVTEGADELALIGSADSLCAVFDDLQVVLLGKCHDSIHVAGNTTHMDSNDSLGGGSDLLFHIGGIHGQGLIDFADYGDSLCGNNGSAGGKEGVAGDENFITRADAAGDQRRDQRAGAGAGGQAVGRTHLGFEFLFESLDLGRGFGGAVVTEQILVIENFHYFFLFFLADLQTAGIHGKVGSGLCFGATIDSQFFIHGELSS